MGFADKLDAMQRATADADAKYMQTLAAARDTYVQIRARHIEQEESWLGNLADGDAQTAAQTSWRDLVAARKALTDTAQTATSTRDQTLADAWTQIRTAA